MGTAIEPTEATAEREPYPMVAIREIDMEIQSLAMQLVDLQRILGVVMKPIPEMPEHNEAIKGESEPEIRAPLIKALLKTKADLCKIALCVNALIERLDI